MNPKHTTILIVIFAILALGSQSIFTVHQTQQALVLQLGVVKDTVYAPGLHFKVPFIDKVVRFDSRILDHDARALGAGSRPDDALTSDLKSIVLDYYAKWRIVDPLTFYTKLKTISAAQQTLHNEIFSQMRSHVARYTLTEVVSTERTAIMDSVTKAASELMQEFGIEVIDARIRRTDLPPENQRAIFERMRAERERQAKQYRSEGVEESTKIRSLADKERAVVLAEAKKKSQILKGEGDAAAAKIFAEAFSQEPDFFAFQRSLEALQKSFKNNTRIVITDDNPLFESIQ